MATRKQSNGISHTNSIGPGKVISNLPFVDTDTKSGSLAWKRAVLCSTLWLAQRKHASLAETEQTRARLSVSLIIGGLWKLVSEHKSTLHRMLQHLYRGYRQDHDQTIAVRARFGAEVCGKWVICSGIPMYHLPHPYDSPSAVATAQKGASTSAICSGNRTETR